ncbi:hypothetical protein ACH3VR_18030 [Microbacterium sp. B2969]|uniref:Uncharacterized protein n=1 Tax=Microbacterium alkaliflavum TaxID=3248839 RepID=A0ABW7QC22_9MICO
MKHVTYAEKSLLMDDTLVALLMEYARLVASAGEGDTVDLPAVGSDGHEVVATFLLTPATVLMAESADSAMRPPTDVGVEADLRKRIRRLSATNLALPEEDGPIGIDDELS